MRLLTLSAVFLTLSSAFLLYALNAETRLLEERLAQQEKQLTAARRDVAVMKAERAHLARPERIAPLARQLGLEEPRPAQLVDAADGVDALRGAQH